MNIIDYDTVRILVQQDENNMYFILKSSCSVAGVNGNIVITHSKGQVNIPGSSLKLPAANSIYDKVVAIQVIIDNV